MQRPSDSSKWMCFRKSPSGCGMDRRPQGHQCWDGARVRVSDNEDSVKTSVKWPLPLGIAEAKWVILV